SQAISIPLFPRPYLPSSPLVLLEKSLETFAAPIPLGDLSQLLSSASLTVEDVAAFCHFNDRHYVRNRVRRGAHYELLCLCWQSGQRSRIHDHHQSNCAVRVLKGTMTSTEFTL